ncbi:MAG: DUF4194 domain-containing protein [Lachnospiraceae bacterium]|nr:DUF4194 domain-containing protein [Lachnospiraceae bacterium]MBR4606876.1 DUF4194 domain-containing protein [Lachnospiraceae bacterium]MBR6151110.1 DUF4194 domain-containing protein [Lachnospiraceae bacterium]
MFEVMNQSVAMKEKFRIAANKLLNQCFLLKKREDTKKEYAFVRENREMFTEYFELLGYELKINEDQGVIGLTNSFGTGRIELTKYDSILLLILRLLYIEKRKELATSSEDVTVLMEEIREKYAMLKIKAKPMLDKGMERGMVRLFRRYNMIQNLDSDVNQADARIVIYPSVIMAVPVENINEYFEMTQKKLEEYAVNKDSEDGDNIDG